MGLGEAVADVIDILRGRPACGDEGRDDWERMVRAWLSGRRYFRRTLAEAPQQARLDAYERHMKYRPTRTYWNDFVFEGSVNYRTEAIFLAGLPDVPESRPHSEVNN